MGVKVVRNRHGFLRLRIYDRGRDVAISTRYRDDGARGRQRRLVEAKAVLIEEGLRQGISLHRVLFEVLGDCPPRLMPRRTSDTRVTVQSYYEMWIARQVPPAVRQSAAVRHRLVFERIILPHLGRLALGDLTPAVLLDFRAVLFQRQFQGRTIKVKTVRNILDGNLRALYRDARDIDGLVEGNPFAALKWPRTIQPEPDPFTAEERDSIVDFFWRKRRHWYWWVLTQFWTGMRPSESTALRVGDVDLGRGEIAITKSRDRGMEAAPKTRRSARTIRLLPNVQSALTTLPLPLHVEPTTYFFRNPEGNPITSQWWPRKSWYPVLRILNIRPRKFYATRHTFISWALSQGANLKWIAEYCGTSIEMIEKSYGKYMTSDGLDPLIRALAAQAKIRPLFAGENRMSDRGETGPQTGPPLAMAVGSDLNTATLQQKGKWSQGESNPRLRRERPPS